MPTITAIDKQRLSTGTIRLITSIGKMLDTYHFCQEQTYHVNKPENLTTNNADNDIVRMASFP